VCAEGIALPAVTQWSKQGQEMFPVEHSLSFRTEGFSLLRSLRNGGRIFADFRRDDEQSPSMQNGE
jgi:hypothetical protein